MKHILLTQLDSEIHQMMEGLEKFQALVLAGLSVSRLWYPYEKWSARKKIPKFIEWGNMSIDILWKQIALGQVWGSRSDFEKYYNCLEKIDRKIEQLEDKGIVVEGSSAYPLIEALNSALCCFFDPKLLPGLQRDSFWADIVAIVGQGSEYIYDDIFTNADEISESDLITMVNADSRWIAERGRVAEDISFLKSHHHDKSAIMKRKEGYVRLDIFVQ